MSFKLSALVWGVDLPKSLKFTLLALADYAKDDGSSVFPSKQELARKMGCSEKTAQRNVIDLENQGYIVRMGKRGAAILYRINTDKLTVSDTGNTVKMSQQYGQNVPTNTDIISQSTDKMSQQYGQNVPQTYQEPINNQSKEESIKNQSSSKESPENLGFPPVTNIDDDDDFLNFDNLAIDGLFRTVFKRDPKMTERHIIAQMLAEDCGNERLTMVLKRCIDLKIVPSSLNYIVTGFNNEKGKVIRIESVQPQDNWWADLIES
jgi:DNA-binding transcriptional regulator YhcF (GntR family)